MGITNYFRRVKNFGEGLIPAGKSNQIMEKCSILYLQTHTLISGNVGIKGSPEKIPLF